jgi:hypothetical protein
MAEEQENVKKIRELDSFETIQPIATGDYLIVATNEGIPATKKASIKEVVDIYNISLIDENEEDQVADPDNPEETIKDPEKEPGKELDEDGDGEPDGKIITTPVNAGNIDTIVQEGGGLKVTTECRKKEDNAIVDCNSADAYYRYNKLGLETGIEYTSEHLTRIHYLEKTSEGTVDPPVMRSAVFPLQRIKFDTFGRVERVYNHIGNILDISHHFYVLDHQGERLSHFFKLDKVSCPNEQFAFDFHSGFYTIPTEDLQKPFDNNWIGFSPTSIGGSAEDFIGPIFVEPTICFDSMWFYHHHWDVDGDQTEPNGWAFTNRTEFPWFYLHNHGWCMFDVENPGTSNVYWSQHVYSMKHEKWVNYQKLTQENPEQSSDNPAPSLDPPGDNPIR